MKIYLTEENKRYKSKQQLVEMSYDMFMDYVFDGIKEVPKSSDMEWDRFMQENKWHEIDDFTDEYIKECDIEIHVPNFDTTTVYKYKLESIKEY